MKHQSWKKYCDVIYVNYLSFSISYIDSLFLEDIYYVALCDQGHKNCDIKTNEAIYVTWKFIDAKFDTIYYSSTYIHVSTREKTIDIV